MSQDRILALQAFAIAHNDAALKSDCWTALGYCSRVAFEPVTVREQRAAQARLVTALEMMTLMGTVVL